MPIQRTPTLSLDEVSLVALNSSREVSSCNIFGIFSKEDSTTNSVLWTLVDETCSRGVKIKLCGSLADYPKPKPGSVVRIHRAVFDKDTNLPMVCHPRNLLVWPPFQANPAPRTIARSPTINDDDNVRRRSLESHFYSTLTKICDIKLNSSVPTCPYFSGAGKITEINKDPYQNLQFKLTDGIASILLRVFAKRDVLESNDHFELAIKLKIGDIVAFTFAKLDNIGRLNLSANTRAGRSLSFVEPASILGVKFCDTTDENWSSSEEPIASQSQSSINTQSTNNNHTTNAPTTATAYVGNDTNIDNTTDTITVDSQTNTTYANNNNNTFRRTSDNNTGRNKSISPKANNLSPPYTKLSDIPVRAEGFYDFFDIAGQVRGKPNETRSFNNWVFQLFDGSKVEYSSYYTEQVIEPMPGCVTILVYSCQKPGDTNQHIEAVKRIEEGNLVMLKNVRASWRAGKLRLEMSANLEHGKSINFVDMSTKFGADLLEIVTNPFVEELRPELMNQSCLDDDSLDSYQEAEQSQELP